MKIEFYYITTYDLVGAQHNFLVDYYGIVYEDMGGGLNRRNDLGWRVV